MKFHCDRCKTRYSISDDRVRGKILKIRCKNCASVITVREQDALPETAAVPPKTLAKAAPESAGSQALAGAFRQVDQAVDPSASTSMSSAPDSLEAEWYLAEDGEQEGPFSLVEAKAWIRKRRPGIELFCWSEGYDDWLSVDKIAHFRNLRSGGAVPEQQSDWDEHTVIDSSAGGREDTPRPLFAATMAKLGGSDTGSEPPVPRPRVAAPAPSPSAKAPAPSFTKPAVPSASPPSAGLPKPGLPKPGMPRTGLAAAPPASTPPDPEPEADNLDFEIGEASRVVSLPLLIASGAKNGSMAAAANGQTAALPSIPNRVLGRGSGSTDSMDEVPDFLRVTAGGEDLPRPELLKPSKKTLGWIPLAAGVVVLAGLAVALVVLLTGRDEEPEYIARGGVSGSGLGYNFDNPVQSGDNAQPKDSSQPESVSKGATKRSTGGPTRDRTVATSTNTATKRVGSFDEVDLGDGRDSEAGGPLDGDDLMQVYSKNQIAIKMCYERALKHDPLLKVPKTWVTIKVDPSGQVVSVSIPSLAGSELGDCIRSRISRWKFRKSTEVFSSQFPVVFDR